MKKIIFFTLLMLSLVGTAEAVSLNTNVSERLNHGNTIQIYKNSTLPNYTSYICRKIQNTSVTDDVFIPLKTEIEFQAFLSNSPGYLLKSVCEITTNCTPKPSNSTEYTAINISQTSGDGVTWLPSNVSYHSNTSTTTTCAYRCNPGYFYNGSACPSTSPGYYAPGYGNTSQTPCTPGNYQPSSAQTSCINATPGYYVPGGTATSQIACSAGTYQPSSGQSSCITASIGYYVPSTGQTSQTACTNKPSNSTYTSSSGLTSNSCPWSCNANYHLEGGVCVYDYQSQVVACSAKPSNSYWNSVSSITQNRNWNGSSWNPWTPTTSTTYSSSSSSSYCQYGCNSGYQNSGASCVPANCSSTSLAGYSVGSMLHGGSTSSSRSYGISNGTMNCTQGFSCSYGNTNTSGGESCTASCNSGYYASGGSCLPYTYTLSYGGWGACSASPTWSSWSACSGGTQSRTCSNTSGTQTRTATCTRDQDGASVSLANCGSVSTSQSCSSSCTGSSTQSCSVAVNGACGSTVGSCITGTHNPFKPVPTDANNDYWWCDGSSGGSSIMCSKPKTFAGCSVGHPIGWYGDGGIHCVEYFVAPGGSTNQTIPHGSSYTANAQYCPNSPGGCRGYISYSCNNGVVTWSGEECHSGLEP